MKGSRPYLIVICCQMLIYRKLVNSMAKRKDNRGRNLRDGESQIADGRYRFRYTDKAGNRHDIYSWRLVSTDRLPEGKRPCEDLRTMEKNISKDKDDGIRTAEGRKITLNDEFEAYMQTKQELKETTKFSYTDLYTRYVVDDIGKRKITDILYSDIKKFYNKLVSQQGLSVSTVDIIHTILHPVFTMAVRDNLIRQNPTDKVLSEVKKAHGMVKKKRLALTIEQQEAFINFVSFAPCYKHWLPFFTVMLGTGGRVGEITGLRWEDCDFKNDVISINHTLVYKPLTDGKYEFHINTPKTQSGCRTIPMLKDVKSAILKERTRQMQKGFSDIEVDGFTGFIFTTGSKGLRTPGSINEAVKRIVKAYNKMETDKAKADGREPVLLPAFSSHTFRHTFATRFCENETNLKMIQDIMGHASITTTMDIYADATQEAKQQSIKNLEGKIKIG